MPSIQSPYLGPSSEITQEDRAHRCGHRAGVLWFTGFSGSGKSTLAIGLEQVMFAIGFQVFVLDGDKLRSGLNKDLGFSAADRQENIRRAAEVAATLKDSGALVISAFISPFKNDRELARKAIGEGFHEIFIDASIDICEARDPKGLYKRARAGEISDFTGISSPYEPPTSPNMALDTGVLSIDTCLSRLKDYTQQHFSKDHS